MQRIHTTFTLRRCSILSALASPQADSAALPHFPDHQTTSRWVMAALCGAIMMGSASAQVKSDAAGIAAALTTGALSAASVARPGYDAPQQATVPALSAYATSPPAATVVVPSTSTAAGTVAPAASILAANPGVTSTAPTALSISTSIGSPPMTANSVGTSAPATQAIVTKEAPLIGVVGDPIAELPPSDLWDRIRAGYAMPDLDDPLVAKWEKFYSERPEYMARIVDRSSKYMFYIVTEPSPQL